MKILHNITYTVSNDNAGARIERTAKLTRAARLTYAGAERIVRAFAKGAIVTRIETAVGSR